MARFVVVGGGRMGRGIALAVAYAGHRVALVDLRTRDSIGAQKLSADAAREVNQALAGLVELGLVAAEDAKAVAERIEWIAGERVAAALSAAEMVFEAVSETAEAKQLAFSRLNEYCDTAAILTSSTSSMSVTRLADMVRHPGRFLNLHWLNPAYVIPLVELSVHGGTEGPVLERARALMTSLGKVPVVCNAAPGYIVPRLQALMLNEVARMIEEGVASPEEIDKATRFGLGLRFAAIGAVEFLDYGGCDILHHVSREMAQSIDAQRYAAPEIVGRMFEQGLLGLKTGRGFYDYRGRDIEGYRRDVLARTVAGLQHAGLWRPAAPDTLS